MAWRGRFTETSALDQVCGHPDVRHADADDTCANAVAALLAEPAPHHAFDRALRPWQEPVANDRATQCCRRDGHDAAARASQPHDRRLNEVEERDRIGVELLAELLRRDVAQISELDERAEA